MSDQTANKKQPGEIGWLDLTVSDAVGVRDFYAAVTGWKSMAVSMGDYEDFRMIPASGTDPVAGIRHARGGNASLPAVWLPYFIVADVDAAVVECRARGGEVVKEPSGKPESGRWCVVRDPAGAYAALYQKS